MERFGAIWSGADVDGPDAEGTSDGGDFGDRSEIFWGSGTSIFVRHMGLDPTVKGIGGGNGDSRGGTKAPDGDVGIRPSIRSSHSCKIAQIARSGRVLRILDARINSPRIWWNRGQQVVRKRERI